MIQIRSDQMLVFERTAEEAFAQEIIAYLDDNHPEAIAGLSQRALIARVSGGIRRGRRYGLSTKIDLLSFVVLQFTISESFDDDPEVAAILNDPYTPDRMRIRSLFANVPPERWHEMRNTAGKS